MYWRKTEDFSLIAGWRWMLSIHTSAPSGRDGVPCCTNMLDRQDPHNVTATLREWQERDSGVLDRLIPLVYGELRRVARWHLRAERAGHILQTTALVREAYPRLVDMDRLTVHSRTHRLALAARLMRQILVDHARKRRAHKRSGGLNLIGLDDVEVAAQAPAVDVRALDEALNQLTAFDARLCHIVELRFFAGLNIDETAGALNISPATVEREWAGANAWLYRRL